MDTTVPTDTEQKACADVEDMLKPFWFNSLTKEMSITCYEFLDLYYFEKKNTDNIVKEFCLFQQSKKLPSILKFGYLIHFYKMARQDGRYPTSNLELEQVLQIVNVRSRSGVMVFSIFTSGYPSYTKVNPDGTEEIVKEYGSNSTHPGMYSCKYDCAYCPDYPDMPRSYLPGEPSVDRAIRNDFIVFKMITDRANQYIQQGHPIDKAEVIIQGGTWDTYSYEYRREFVRDVYYTFNVIMEHIFKRPLRKPLSMEEEIKLNELGACRIVGLTPETRPDQINYKSIQFLRQIGATRVQLGIQHTDDKVLEKVNRACYTKHTIQAIQMLKDCGFKIVAHLMPDLPHPDGYEGRMPEVDREMFHKINTDPNLKIDYVKVYPCVTIPHTKIKLWLEQGTYKPYGGLTKYTQEEKIAMRKMSKKEKMELRLQNPLYRNIMEFYKSIHPSMRVERMFRDIPTKIICAGTTQSSLRSELDEDLELMGELTRCIRHREAGSSFNSKRKDIGEPVLKVLEFPASQGTEYFLSWESNDERPVLYSFLRLRLSANSGCTQTGKVIFPELVNCALIREVHTYGKVVPCKENQKYYKNSNILFEQNEETKPQHKGFGKRLIERAEQIAKSNGYKQIAVIAGVGAREYYRKLGYTTDSPVGNYQIKYMVDPVPESVQESIEDEVFNYSMPTYCYVMFMYLSILSFLVFVLGYIFVYLIK
jgi:ELP3 family radical SAM enzyme/protein acetyltransferase